MSNDLFVGKRILIVGDNSQSFDYLRNILETTPASLIHAENGKDAVEICKDINPDVILLDRQLQNTETYDVIRQIVTLQPNKCVIVLAEDSASDDKDILLKLGCKEFLVKPVTGNVLLETVKKYFHNY